MQMSLIVVTGYALASAPPVHAVIRWMARFPATGPGAVAFVALFSMLSSLLSWSFSLIFSGLPAREVAARVKDADYRAVGAAAYLGVGSGWALGLSSSAALIMATPKSLPESIANISGVIPLGETLGLWQSMTVAAVLIVVSMAVAYFSAPAPAEARGMAAMGVEIESPGPAPKPERPGEWLEYSPLPTLLICVLGIGYLAREIDAQGVRILLDLNHYILAFLIVGMLLHGRPNSFVRAAGRAAAPVVGILKLKARDIVGYSMLQFVVHVPLVLFLVWILNYTL
jgi:short-chain fatty acids transporter